MPEFVGVLLMAKEWGVPPWDLVAPESKGHECWLVWMQWAKVLLNHGQRIQQLRAEEERRIKQATGRR